MSAAPEFDRHMTEAEYLAFERASESKHEYFDGEIYAMSGANQAHNLIVANVIAALRPQIRGKGCQLYPSDMWVRVPATGSYAYPDVTIMCGEAQFDGDQRDVLLNPIMIIEVLSESTEAFDRGLKFQRYRELESLREYVLIDQHQAHIEHFTRTDSGIWQLSEASGKDSTLELVTADCELRLVEVYEDVDFSATGDE